MGRRVVVVFGGNAFSPPERAPSMAGQFEFAREALEALSPLIDEETELLLSHGNGPQVGHMLVRVERALGEAYALPLEVCVAESEGELGYVIQQTLHNQLVDRGIRRSVVSLLTQVVVDADDPAFERPEKPIGPAFDRVRADELEASGLPIVEDAGRGYRRVVASPRPLEVVEVAVIADLLSRGTYVVAAGGGGIPVVRVDGRLRGVEAVVDKDHAAALIGEQINAELLVIVTGVPCVYENFGRPDQTRIERMCADDARTRLAAGEFAAGSMAPKVEACVRFVESGRARRALITDAQELREALAGQGGTWVEA